ncbi:MAG: hypothetical protein JNM55_01490 [Anaerolineales bacterium]|nr:hypothetical protein [Anaerolineales bacterium]
MNKSIRSTLSLLALSAAMLLAACATTQLAAPVPAATDPAIAAAVEVPATAVESSAATVELSTTYTGAVSIEQQLILGTFKLEGTSLAVSKEQASILLPLYTNLKTVVESSVPAQGTQGDPGTQPQGLSAENQDQIDGIVEEILAVMTSGQIQSISQMQITRETAQTIMSEQGITMDGPGGQGQQGGAMPEGNGQPPEGTPPVGGPDGGGAGMPEGGQPGGGMIPTELIDALIKLLQSKQEGP